MELVSSASKKFIVIKMEDNDFIDLDPLQPCFKKTVNGIRQMQWLHFEKGSPYTLFYKKSAADGLETFSKVEMKAKPSRGRNHQSLPAHLPTVNEKPRLKPAKFKDLMDRLPYIPPFYHGFYQSLR